MSADATTAAARLAQLAADLECLTSEDLQLLADCNESTIESWRKRGDGPAYVRAGNRFLYPRAAVSEWLQSRIRERRNTPAGGTL
jgi:predicted DNA-binding transcriptional regulator AlpA